MEFKTRTSANRRRKAIVLTSLVLILFMLAAFTPSSSFAAGEKAGARGKVVVIIVDRVSPSDFPSKDTPFCMDLAEKWSFALMVTRVSYDTPVEESLGADYVTLGSGVRSRGASNAGLSFGSGEIYEGYRGPATAGEYFSLYSGMEAPPGGIVSLGWNEIARNNKAKGLEENSGLMGDLLAENDCTAAVLGNGDTLSKPMRLAPLIACCSKGTVPLGDVSNGLNVLSPETAGGYCMDPDRLADRAVGYLDGADMVIVDTGDTARIDSKSSETDDRFLEEQRREALGRVDAVAKNIAGALDLESSLLLVVTPRPPAEARGQGNYLTPFIAAGRGYGDGLVTSSTTKKPGLVDNSDFLPTVLQFFKIKIPSAVSGNPMEFKGSDVGPGEMARISEQSDVSRKARWPGAVIALLGMLAVALLALLCLPGVRERIPRLSRPEAIGKIIGPASIVLLAFPLSMFLSGSLRYGNYMIPTLFCLALSTLLGLVSWRFQRGRKRLDPAVSICLLSGAVIIVDLLFGGRLMALAPVGSTALEGMRYFGLTNTMVSILLACTVWSIAGIAGEDAFKPGTARLVAIGSMLTVSLITGLGILGANIGGFLVAGAAFLIFFLTGSRRRLSKWWLISVPVIAAAGVLGVALLDAILFHSHVGKAVSSGSGQMMSIYLRRLGVQFAAMKGMSGPILVVIVAILAIVLWMRSDNSVFFDNWENAKPQFSAFYSMWAGGLIAVLFEDTGFLMLGVMIYISVGCGCYYFSEHILKQNSEFRIQNSEEVVQ